MQVVWGENLSGECDYHAGTFKELTEELPPSWRLERRRGVRGEKTGNWRDREQNQLCQYVAKQHSTLTKTGFDNLLITPGCVCALV